MSQGVVLQSSNIVWAQNNGYEQVWQSLKCAQCFTAKAVPRSQNSRKGSIIREQNYANCQDCHSCYMSFQMLSVQALIIQLVNKVFKNTVVLQQWQKQPGQWDLYHKGGSSFHYTQHFPFDGLDSHRSAWDKIYGVCTHRYKNQQSHIFVQRQH